MAAYTKINVTSAFKENPFGVAVITPRMKRAHSLRGSEEILSVDATSACDAENHAFTFMCTLCAAGAVPVGIFITKGRTEEYYKQGFHLLMYIMKQSAFNGNGAPATFITDDSEA
ncbi:hypothetical protein AVEN_206937-1 [Araneus ventricosus]|uniref:MULE transposase domain-containing protein n=1 Tax=Araneus ventricosus TaxID=182803 RepID=A0A4Y2PS51_ARAVE|nr:hypothetical protein AVEN_206937-1 [Araneus ventricosus]